MEEKFKKTILITGGAGFVGSHLCARYLNEGHRVIVLDNLQKTNSTVNIDKFKNHSNFTFIKHDIIEPININQKVDWVLNFACPVSCIDLQVDPIHTTRSNVEGVINMLEIARKNNAVFLQASSSDVYGVREKGDVLKEDMLGQIDTLTARACYEEGKRIAETICMDYYRKYNVNVKIIRIFNTYGPNMYYRDGRVMSNFIIAALNNQDLNIYGDGSYTRCHMYVYDLVEGVDKMAKTEHCFIGPVNLGSTKEITVKELAEIVIKMTNSKSIINYERELTGDPRFRKPDIGLAKNKLDWEPRVSLEEGVRETIEHYQNLELPEKKIIVFATTYYPDMGPAERAIMEMTKTMPDTEFYIIATKSRKKLGDFERIENNFIFRVGSGNVLGKYLFPIRGAIKAYKLTQKYNFRFVWSVMASYGGLAAVILKLFNKKMNFLLTFDKSEFEKRGFFRKRVYLPLYKLIFKIADSIYITDEQTREKALTIHSNSKMELMQYDKQLANQIKKKYSELLDKQENKLARPM
jgi:UDP-glucuronate decarboxylase